MGQDEPWIAAAPYKLATSGILGSDLFTGYYGMEHHHLQHMPVYPLAQAAIFRIFGAGVIQMRALPVACGLLLLAAVFLVGSQTGDERVGAIALTLMLVLRIAEGGQQTGVLLLDSARINRYDILVPVFGLLALWTFNRAERDRRDALYLLAGVLAGLSSLTHLYGGFWLPILFGLLMVRRGRELLRERAGWLLLAGFALPWIPWAALIAAHWQDFAGQMRMAPGRFDLLDPRFYIDNTLHGDGPLSIGWTLRTLRGLPMVRIGAWTMAIGVPAALAVIAWTRRSISPPAIALAIAALLQTTLFAVLLKAKFAAYMIALWPLGALLLAWLAIALWDRRSPAIRLVLVVWLALIGAESGTRVAEARAAAREATPVRLVRIRSSALHSAGLARARPAALLARPAPVSLSLVAAADRSVANRLPRLTGSPGRGARSHQPGHCPGRSPHRRDDDQGQGPRGSQPCTVAGIRRFHGAPPREPDLRDQGSHLWRNAGVDDPAATLIERSAAAGHVDEGAGGIGRFVGSSHRIARATSLASPPRFIGTPAFTRSTRPGSPPLGVDVGVDQARAHGVHADAFLRHFLREPDGERVDGALRGRVVHVLAGRAELRGPRRDVDDRAARAAVARGHAPHRFARAQEGAGDVGGEHALEARGVHLVQAHLVLEDAGVVDQRRDRAQLRVARSKSRTTSASLATSPAIASAAPPAALIAATTASAAACVAQVVHATA